jgi:hypothetical protein
LDAGKQMIEKLPFWENPDLEIDKKELIKSELLAEFPLLLNFPHYVGSHYAFSFQGNLTSDTYTYTFSDGSTESFELQFQDTHPSGDVLLDLVTTENYYKRYFSVQKLKEELFLVSYVPKDFSYLQGDNEDSEIDRNSEIEFGEDWAETAADESAFYYENKRQKEQTKEYVSSEFKDAYDEAVKNRNFRVDEIAFDRTDPEIYLSIHQQLPDYKSTLSQTPSYKSGELFTRYFLFDYVSKKDLPRIILGEPITTHDIGIWQAGRFKDKILPSRSQPVAYIKPNGRILWNSSEDRYIFSLEILAILQELVGENKSVINKEELDLIVYDSRGNSEGNVFIIRALSKDLARSIVKTINAHFGSLSPKFSLTLEPDLHVHRGNNEKLEINLYDKPDRDFASEFLRVRHDLAI